MRTVLIWLGLAARVVGLADPSEPPLTALGRLETEAALAQAGVMW